MKRIRFAWVGLMAAVLALVTMPDLSYAQANKLKGKAADQLTDAVMSDFEKKAREMVANEPISDAAKDKIAAELTEAARPAVKKIIDGAAAGRLPKAKEVTEKVAKELGPLVIELVKVAMEESSGGGGSSASADAYAESGSVSSSSASRPAAASWSASAGNVINVPGDAKTISEAMATARMGDTVLVGPGVYRERVIMAPGVHLVSRSLFEAKIDGKGKGTVVTMSKNCTVSGFEIRNGTIGIFSSDLGNEISSCRIVKNWMTGIITVRHLPKIQDNIIAFNRASGIQGWDVRSTAVSVNHNSIAYNGNHGIAVGGSSEFIIENNIIAFNERFGLKLLKGSQEKVQVSSNNFFRNLFQPGSGSLLENNHAFDPAFIAPRSGLNFKPDPGQCCKAKSSGDENLGSRLTY